MQLNIIVMKKSSKNLKKLSLKKEAVVLLSATVKSERNALSCLPECYLEKDAKLSCLPECY